MAVLFLLRNNSSHVGRLIMIVPIVIVIGATILFFVRVNQVLVRLWARHQSSVSGCRLSEVSDDGPSGTGDGRRSADV